MEELGIAGIESSNIDVVVGVGSHGRNIEWDGCGPEGTSLHIFIDEGVLVVDKGTEHVAFEVHVLEMGRGEPDSTNVESLSNTWGNGVGVSVGLGSIHDEVHHSITLGDDHGVGSDFVLEVEKGSKLALDNVNLFLHLEGSGGGEEGGGGGGGVLGFISTTSSSSRADKEDSILAPAKSIFLYSTRHKIKAVTNTSPERT